MKIKYNNALLSFLLIISLASAEVCKAAEVHTTSSAIVDLIFDHQDYELVERRMRDSFERYVASLAPSESQKPIVDLYRDEFEKLLQSATRADKAKKVMNDLYAELYTADELKDLLDFYKSPLGIKVIKTSPVISEKTKAVTLAYVDSNLKPELVALLDRMHSQLSVSSE